MKLTMELALIASTRIRWPYFPLRRKSTLLFSPLGTIDCASGVRQLRMLLQRACRRAYFALLLDIP